MYSIKISKGFVGDISEGYNNANGAFDIDWNWLNNQKPPPGVSRQVVYTNEMSRVKQDKIDWKEAQHICFQAPLLGVPLEYASLTMLVHKSSFRDHTGNLETRFLGNF